MSVLSSASVGGGPGLVRWVLNSGVGSDYDRTDLSEHARELGVRGAGVAMFTAVDLSRRQSFDFEGVAVDATVGISHPTWTAEPPETEEPVPPGTINLVIQMPVGSDPGAAVNAVVTATEAKTQALAARGVQGTGTATDAVTIVWPQGLAAERFAGPGSGGVGGSDRPCTGQSWQESNREDDALDGSPKNRRPRALFAGDGPDLDQFAVGHPPVGARGVGQDLVG